VRVRRAVRIAAGERVVVGVSGGPDSVVLAAVLDRIARADGFDVVFAYVNHGTRPSALQDECVVLSLGARLGRPVRVASIATGSDEQSLRIARYAALTRIAREAGASLVATAHCAEDQTETVLLALFRGSGLDGLAGMAPRRRLVDGVDLIRPFLRVTHAELDAELFRLALPYARDPSNDERRYRRNALRPRLAGLREDFPALDAAVARCAEIVRAARSGEGRARARDELRAALRVRGELRDVPFERIEAALDARAGRVFLKPGLTVDRGEAPRMNLERAIHPDLECVLFSEAEIAAAIDRIAQAIARDYVGRDVLLLGVLKGAVHVFSDLARRLETMSPGPKTVFLDVISVSSYGNASRSSGEVRLIQDSTHAIEGRDVVIVEDIIDNGLTLQYLNSLLGARRPASLRSAVLLDKPYRRIADVHADYVGLTCPDEFIVGYGLDYQERYRTLPYIAKLRPEIFSDVPR
jgi:hypoxanthine phosphoribosyltransferase